MSETCVITSKETRDADSDANPAVAEINNPRGATFKIKDKIICTSSRFIKWSW